MKKKKIGLALGGGGARGLAHIGVLKVLQKEGIKIDVITGTSMGAFVAAYYALGYDLEKLEKEVLSFTKAKAIKTFVDLASPKISVLKGIKSEKYIEKFLGKNVNFNQTKIPLKVVCTDLGNGDEVILSKGNISKAVRASISVPGVFPPVKIGKHYLIDGAVINPTPVDVAKDMGADVVIGVDLIMQREAKLKNPSLATALIQTYEIVRAQAIKFNMKKVDGKVVLVKPEVRSTIDSFKFYDIDKFIASGEKATRKALPKIKNLMHNA